MFLVVSFNEIYSDPEEFYLLLGPQAISEDVLSVVGIQMRYRFVVRWMCFRRTPFNEASFPWKIGD